MRGRTLLAIGLLAAGFALALVGRFSGAQVTDPLAGLLIVAAVGVALSLLPFWARLRALPMPGLFQPPSDGERWCDVCGRPAPPGTCPRCRTQDRRSRRRQRRLQRKPSFGDQESKR